MTRQRDLFQWRVPPRDKQELKEKFPNMDPNFGRPRVYPPSRPDRYKRIITPDEANWGTHLGTQVWERGKKLGCKTRYGKNDSPEALLVSDIQGMRAEIVVCSVEDLAYPADYLDRWGRNDLGPLDGPGICVRCRPLGSKSIIVQQHDPDASIVVLVFEIVPGREYREHAYVWVRDAKKIPLSDPPRRGPDGTLIPMNNPAHFVYLTIDGKANPIVHFLGNGPGGYESLPEEILRMCPKGYRVGQVK